MPVVQSNVLESSGVFSPNGRWIAYAATEAGQPNIFVQAFPGPGGKYQVTRDGGGYPAWRADGKELFYLAPDSTLTAVPIEGTEELTIGAAQSLFQAAVPRVNPNRVYAVTKDGQRFLLRDRPQHTLAEPLTVVVNWPSAIQR